MVGKIASRLKNHDSVRICCAGLGAQIELLCDLHETFWKESHTWWSNGVWWF